MAVSHEAALGPRNSGFRAIRTARETTLPSRETSIASAVRHEPSCIAVRSSSNTMRRCIVLRQEGNLLTDLSRIPQQEKPAKSHESALRLPKGGVNPHILAGAGECVRIE